MLSDNLVYIYDQKFEHNIVASCYNVYNRRNPFSVFFRTDPNEPTITQAVQFSVVGSFIPAISYNFKF